MSGKSSIPHVDMWGERNQDMPEKRLMVAVLMNALECLLGFDVRCVAETEDWIRGNVGGDHWPYSFHNVCEELDLDVDYLTRGLLNIRRAVVAHGEYRANLRRENSGRYRRISLPRAKRARRGSKPLDVTK